MSNTGVKFIREIDTMSRYAEEEDNGLNQTIFECYNCHWRFVGDCIRYGYEGYDWQRVQMPNYCPMCGKKIEKEIF